MPAKSALPALLGFCSLLALTALAAAQADHESVRKVNLEGGSLPGEKGAERIWTDNVKMSPRPDAAARAGELKARKEAIATEIARLKQRLQRAPDAATQKRIDAKLDELIANYGVEAAIPRAFSLKDLKMMRTGQSALPQGLLNAIIQFKKDLEARGVDLILMPVAPDGSVYMNLLVDGVTPQTDVWPGFTQMMLQFLENDIEVIDTVDAFRADAKNPVSVIFPNDPHTGSRGRQIFGEALAKRLQRYGFARELAKNRDKFSYETKTIEGSDIFGGTLYFSKAWEVLKQYTGQADKPSVPGRTLEGRKNKLGKMEWLAPQNESMLAGLLAIRKQQFECLQVKASLARPDEVSCLDMVFLGDSQLHSAVHGSGLPEIVGAEVGGRFRWASKSWSGFSAPEIYLQALCPDDKPEPRVAVMWFLPFKFEKKEKDEFSPRPMPPYKAGAVRAAAASALPNEPFEATIKVTAVSRQLDPASVQYKEALTQSAAVITDGKFAGTVIGVRYWTMADAVLVAAAGKVKPGDTFKVTLQPWDAAVAADKKLGQHMVYNDTNQDWDVPIFWVTKGPLAPDQLLGKAAKP